MIDIVDKRILILDRDGVINEKSGDADQKYILNASMLSIYQDFLLFAIWASEFNLPIYVATNQQCVGLGLVSKRQLIKIHDKIQEALLASGANKITHFYVCEHLINTCNCRKPNPGLLTNILLDSGCEPDHAVFFGDSLSDYEAAKSAAIPFIQIKRGKLPFTKNNIEDFSDLLNFMVKK